MAYSEELMNKIEDGSSVIDKNSEEQSKPQKAPSETNGGNSAITDEEVKTDNKLAKIVSPSNYGDYVYYPIDLNEDGDYTNDWKIFYSNEENIFLISADYLSNTSSYLNIEASKMVTDGTNVMYWEDKPNYQEVNNDVQKMFMAKVYNLNSNMSNSKCISTLLNSSNWTKFVKDTYADYSIGSPTLEMWIESWNGKYKNEKELYYSSGENGYYIGNSLEVDGFSLSSTEMSEVAGYKDTLYYPHNDAYNACYGYWLSSPSQSSTDNLIYIGYNGSVNVDSYMSDLLRY